MPSNETTTTKLQFRLPGVAVSEAASRALGPATRGSAGPADALLASLTVEQHFDLSAPSRATRQETTLEAAGDDILALEMEEGFILYTSAARLADDLRRLDPEAERDGALRLDALRQRGPATRGLGDWVVRAVSVLRLGKDKIIDVAVEKAKKWVGDRAVKIVEEGATWAGTKALMWAIEQQLKPGPGLYSWVGDDGASSDLQTAKPADFQDWRPEQPILVFIHGTASSTLGSFGAFREPPAAREWQALRAKYGEHIYAFEHRTFSESPIENALGLIQALPAGARLSVVTHSRGGQVGDLLCLAGLGAEQIARFSHHNDDLGDLKEADEEDRRNLLALDRLLAEKNFRVERYVRVACPAQGTLLAGSNTDAFLSVLLHLIGLVPILRLSPTYAVVKRVVLQIAKNRTDPRRVPGIEAMLPNSPLTALLGQATPKDGAEIAVIAGDIEGGGLLKRIGVFLTDYLIFEQEDNDLVVDTDSMYGGLARERGRYLFDQGADVSHFRYFANNRTLRALQNWLTQEKPTELREFEPIQPAPQARKVRAAVTGPRPAVIFLPGILGSHLRVGEKDRVWFDFLDITHGGLEKIQYDRPNISPDGLFDRYYGDLCDYLEDSHEVRRFAYDWRRPLRDEAARLAAEVEQALNATPLPVRLMTHSMGGLVVRTLIARHRPVWDRLMQRQDAYWVMLGVPNCGSHLIVETLLGLGDSPRQLALADTRHDLQWILDLIAAYPGMVQLLPRPGFGDTGNSPFDYYTDATWRDFKKANDDFWFGKQLGGVPAVPLLAAAKQSWQELAQNEQLPNVERIAYVAGYGRETPCGIEKVKIGGRERVRMIGTLNGDGSVTHDSGLLDGLRQNGRIWYMDADHADLTNTPEKFPALLELLERGETTRLPTTRPTVRGAEQTFRYEAGPVLYPTEQSLARMLLGGRKPVRRRGRAKYTLKVSCRGMDVRYARDPILVGHYRGDAISAAEAQIDWYVVDRSLTRRHSLGLYAGAPGTATVVLLKTPDEQAKAGIQRGAIVIGLGELGELTTATLGEAVRGGVLRYLMQIVDREGGLRTDRREVTEVGLATLLLGYNSTTHISIEDSVSTIVRGVMVANRQFAEAMETPLRVGRLEFIELYQDVAITAAYAVREIGDRLAKEAAVLGCRIEAAPMLECGEGLCSRLEAMSGSSYWPRLIVTDADRRDDLCPPECREDRSGTRPTGFAAPGSLAQDQKAEAQPPRLSTHPERRPELARRLRFVFLSQRARAETVEHQRQPGLVETLVERSISKSTYQADLSRTLFHLMVPHDFKEAARQAANLVLVVDSYTANLPWEMLVADEKPLVLNTAMVRQLASTRFRLRVRGTLEKRAYVVGNPSTKGYYTAFPSPRMPDRDALDPLPGAAQEARAVADLLMAQGYQVIEAPPDSEAVDVINKLFKYPYRIVHISAHGVFQAGEGEAARSGVVLSDGLLLTAAEIGQMEIVPDLVFLNCCFLGKTDNAPTTAYNRLAYSVARELIEIGVRAVVVAGWAVRDDAAKHFAEVFYQSLLQRQLPFGRAVHEARRQTHENENFSNCNTWGAFQAYGDPSFVLDPSGQMDRGNDDWNPVAPEELVARIEQWRIALPHAKRGGDSQAGERYARRIQGLLGKPATKPWSALPEVLCALGRFHAENGDFEQAIAYYGKAITEEDQYWRIPIMAIEQLANLEARQGEKTKDVTLVLQGIKRLLGLLNAADGVGNAGVNSERCALLGSAYKHLAKLLESWSSDAGTPDQPQGVRQALERSAHWYGRGEGDPNRADFSPYCAQNRLAVLAMLGGAGEADAALALRVGEIARQRYATSRDSFDLIMAADGVLIARLLDGGLQDRPEEVEREIVDCYRNVREQLPESARQLDSVITQIHSLADFIEKRSATESGVEELAKQLRRIADLLEGKSKALARKRPVTPAPLPPGSTTGESEEASPVADADVSPARSPLAEGDLGDQPADPPKARKKRPEK